MTNTDLPPDITMILRRLQRAQAELDKGLDIGAAIRLMPLYRGWIIDAKELVQRLQAAPATKGGSYTVIIELSTVGGLIKQLLDMLDGTVAFERTQFATNFCQMVETIATLQKMTTCQRRRLPIHTIPRSIPPDVARRGSRPEPIVVAEPPDTPAPVSASQTPDEPGDGRSNRGPKGRNRMRWNSMLTQLRDALAELYPTREDSYLVVDDAGLARGKITFSDASRTNWHAILREALLQQKVSEIIDIARAEYGRDADLRVASEAYLQQFSPQASAPSMSPTISSSADKPSEERRGAAVISAPAKTDLIIVTAMPEELDPVLKLNNGLNQWDRFTLDSFVHYHSRFQFGSQALSVVACSLWKYGGGPTTAAIVRLKSLQPKLIAMTGICAGWEAKEIHFGDVIVAERAFHAGEGKETTTGLQPDTQTYQPPPWLVQWLKDFSSNQQWATEIKTPRPLSLRYQAEWVMCHMVGRDIPYPNTEVEWNEAKTTGIDVPRAKKLLLDNGLITKDGVLTERAQPLLDWLRQANHGRLAPLADADKPSVHYGAFASTEAIVAVENPFLEHSKRMRNVRAIELEVASLFAAAEEIAVPAFAVKGVSDYGTPDKDDAFHAYAAEASARWMYAFASNYAELLPARQG